MRAELGPRLREARQMRGLSLRATATQAGVSPSLLSQVETGKVQPSVSTLYALVSCLDLSFDQILGLQPDAPAPRRRRRATVQAADHAPVIEMENGVTWEGLAVLDRSGEIDAVLATYAPGGASAVDGAQMRHSGVEHGYLITGELTLHLDKETHRLRVGDSFVFDAARPHLYVNETDAPAKGVFFVVGRTASREQHGPDVRTAVDVLEAMSAMPRTGRD